MNLVTPYPGEITHRSFAYLLLHLEGIPFSKGIREDHCTELIPNLIHIGNITQGLLHTQELGNQILGFYPT